MPGRMESWNRLEREAWVTDPRFIAGLASQATVQSVTGGMGSNNYDEYSILVDMLPPGSTPSSFLMEMAHDLNGTVNDGLFSAVNQFSVTTRNPPQVGDLVHIYIPLDSGSVAVAVIEPNYFIFMTVNSTLHGSHPEWGSREFGMETEGHSWRLYTRGCSRPGNLAVAVFGAAPQNISWSRLCRGLSDTIDARGGISRPGSFIAVKESR
jgi:hypothetical protein